MLDSLHRFHGLNSLSFTYKRGQVVRGGQLSLRYALNIRRNTYRAAVVVSKKVDKSAVVRNRIRRRVYEVVRQQLVGVTEPYDLIFTVFNPQLATIEADQLEKQVAELLKRAGVHATIELKKTEEN